MRRGTRYRVTGGVYIGELRIARVNDEREYERRTNDYSHHIDPLRERFDVIKYEALATAGRDLTDLECKAFELSISDVFSHFEHVFSNNLHRLRREAEAETAKD